MSYTFYRTMYFIYYFNFYWDIDALQCCVKLSSEENQLKAYIYPFPPSLTSHPATAIPPL